MDRVTLPSISVAICTRDRPAALQRCLRSVCAQDHKPQEIIVVDDGSIAADACQRLARQVRQNGMGWAYYRKTEPGLTRSRNLALAHATGQIVQFFDDDAEPDGDYLGEIAALFAADATGRVAVLGGTVIEPALTGLGGRAWRLATRLAGWWSLGRRGMQRGPWPEPARLGRRVSATLNVTGAALAVRRDAVYPPGFDEALTGYALGEDRELGYRLSRTHLVGRAARARAVHHHDPAGRLDPERFGHDAVYNYCYILHKNIPMGLGEWLAVLWSLTVLAGLRLGLAVVRHRRRHLLELGGMIRGSGCWVRHCLRQVDFCW